MEAILYICILAVGHAVFMAAVLLYLNHRLSNRLLAILLILLAVRIGKSVVQMLLKPDMSYTTSVVGVIAMASIGPVLLLFIRSLFSSNARFRPIELLHFLPAASLPVFVFSGWKLLSPVYYAMTAHVILYTLWSWYHLFRNSTTYKTDDLRWQWAILFLSAVTILESSFVLQVTVYEPTIYLSNVIIAALVLYALSFWAIKRARIFISDPTSPPENVAVLNDLGTRILVLFDREVVYTDTALTVSKLAMRLKVPPYLASRAINHHFRKSFSELVVEYRLAKAEELLKSDRNVHTIEAIAFESGFNTLSAFYSAFKKTYGTTPSQFRLQKGGGPGNQALGKEKF